MTTATIRPATGTVAAAPNIVVGLLRPRLRPVVLGRQVLGALHGWECMTGQP